MSSCSKPLISEIVSDAVVQAGTCFSEQKKESYRKAILAESDDRARWVLQTILDNALVAERNRSPLCDDTGIPHLLLDIGSGIDVPGSLFDEIYSGVRQGLRKLPGRPMAVLGNDMQRLDQSGGLSEDPGDVECAPVQIRRIADPALRLHVLLMGGGPAIRGTTYRIFHKHSVEAVLNEIVERASSGVVELGCSPCTLAIGIGRSQPEAASLMIQAQVDGDYSAQSDFERSITSMVNERCRGPMNLGGHTSVFATFAKIGPQRASGVRIVCIRPCCCFEPRLANVDLLEGIRCL